MPGAQDVAVPTADQGMVELRGIEPSDQIAETGSRHARQFPRGHVVEAGNPCSADVQVDRRAPALRSPGQLFTQLAQQGAFGMLTGTPTPAEAGQPAAGRAIPCGSALEEVAAPRVMDDRTHVGRT